MVTSTPTERNPKMKWTRIEDDGGRGYQSGNTQVWDNGAGVGAAAGSGRWALLIDGRWVANLDTLAAAKAQATS
jgi:hypothetical protein